MTTFLFVERVGAVLSIFWWFTANMAKVRLVVCAVLCSSWTDGGGTEHRDFAAGSRKGHHGHPP